jgi:uncharacterized protein
MKSFVAILKDKNKGKLTDQLLDDHVRHLAELSSSGHLITCGPFENDTGAVQVLKAATHVAAIALVENDPFIAKGYYSTYELNEFFEATEENEWLMKHPQTETNIGK